MPDMNKNIYIICSVRSVGTTESTRLDEYVLKLEAEGHNVHYPPRDVEQRCNTGMTIVDAHGKAMRKCDEVHILWNVNSQGSHFDLGMAYALGKPIIAIDKMCGDECGKSYWKVIKKLEERNDLPVEIDSDAGLKAHYSHILRSIEMSEDISNRAANLKERTAYKMKGQENDFLRSISGKTIIYKNHTFRYEDGCIVVEKSDLMML